MPKKTSIQKRRKTVPGSKSQGTRKTSSSAQTTRPAAKAKPRKSAPTDTIHHKTTEENTSRIILDTEQFEKLETTQIEREYIDTIINQLPIPIAIFRVNEVNGEYQYIYEFVNESISKLNNRTKKEHIGHSLEEIITVKEAAQDIKANFRNVIKSKKITVRQISIPIKGKLGQLLEFHFPIEYNNSVVSVGAALIDITELVQVRKEAEKRSQELQESHQKLETRVQERTKELLQRNQQLKNLLAHLENVREEERVHIAREVHDELGQILLAFKFDLSELKELISPDSKGIGNLVKKLIKNADTTLESVQRILIQLRPQVLDIFGVGPAFEWQAKEFQKQTGITCEVKHFPENLQIEKDKSLILFRIFQEALMNVKHHAQASRVQISFSVNSEDMIMEIKDNGVGMKLENVNDPQSFGILGIQERADLLGGTASFRSNPGEGTTVSIRLPK